MAAAGHSAKPARDPNALTRGQKILLDRISRAGGVFRSRAVEDGRGTETWYFVNDYGRPNPATIDRLIAKGRLKPTGDGLFGNDSQTFVPNL